MRMAMQKPPRQAALVSIHDVMPETLTQTAAIVRFLERLGVHRLTMLVVPAKQWSSADLAKLHQWQACGIELAGHGWQHRAARMATAWHRLHGLLVSRNEAEHLSLDQDAAACIVSSCYRWFAENGLASPTFYVPPAWAMGRLSRSCLAMLPFAFYETHAGVWDTRTRRFVSMPVVGYMADTAVRTAALRAWNAVNLALPGAAVRIAVHPQDLNLPLKTDLERHLARFRRFETCSELMAAHLAALPSRVGGHGLAGPEMMSTPPSKSET